MTSRTKVAVDEGVSGQEALRLPWRLEPLHLPFSAPGRPMGILSAIVQVAALTVLDIRQELALRHAVAFQLVRVEEALRRPRIAAGLDQNIKHDAVLIDGAPEIMQLALDPNEHLVQVPLVTGPGPAPTKTIREARAKLQAPAPNALVGDNHAALRQEQLDVPKAQAEYVV